MSLQLDHAPYDDNRLCVGQHLENVCATIAVVPAGDEDVADNVVSAIVVGDMVVVGATTRIFTRARLLKDFENSRTESLFAK